MAAVALLGGAGVLVYSRWYAATGGEKMDSRKWEQLTIFTDSAVYPALSPDGRILAYLRRGKPFIGPANVYVRCCRPESRAIDA